MTHETDAATAGDGFADGADATAPEMEAWLASGDAARRRAAATAYPLLIAESASLPAATAVIDAGGDPARAIAHALGGCYHLLGEAIRPDTVARLRGLSSADLGRAASTDPLLLLSYLQATERSATPRNRAEWEAWDDVCAHLDGHWFLLRRSLRAMLLEAGRDWRRAAAGLADVAPTEGRAMHRQLFDLLVTPAALLALERVGVDLAAFEGAELGDVYCQLTLDIGPAFDADLLGDRSLERLLGSIRAWNRELDALVLELFDPGAARPLAQILGRHEGPGGTRAAEISTELEAARLARTYDLDFGLLFSRLNDLFLFDIRDARGAPGSALGLLVYDEPGGEHLDGVRPLFHRAPPGRIGPARPEAAAAEEIHERILAEREAGRLDRVRTTRLTNDRPTTCLADLHARIGFRHDDRARRDAAYARIRPFLSDRAPETLDAYLRGGRVGRALAPWARDAQAYLRGRLGARRRWSLRMHDLDGWEEQIARRGLGRGGHAEARAAVERLL